MKIINNQKDAKKYDDLGKEEQEKWDNRELGNDPKHASPAQDLGSSKSTTFRLPVTMIADLKKIAKEEGVPYQTLVKSVLHKFIKSKNAS